MHVILGGKFEGRTTEAHEADVHTPLSASLFNDCVTHLQAIKTLQQAYVASGRAPEEVSCAERADWEVVKHRAEVELHNLAHRGERAAAPLLKSLTCADAALIAVQTGQIPDAIRSLQHGEVSLQKVVRLCPAGDETAVSEQGLSSAVQLLKQAMRCCMHHVLTGDERSLQKGQRALHDAAMCVLAA